MRHEILRTNVPANECSQCTATTLFALYRADDGREWLLCHRKIGGRYCHGTPSENRLVQPELQEAVVTDNYVRDIDDVVSPDEVGGGELRDLTNKRDLLDVPLRLEAFRGPFSTDKGDMYIFDATRLDTGDEISFSGATVLDKKGERCKENGLFPVNAKLVKQKPLKGGNAYYNFVSPEKE